MPSLNTGNAILSNAIAVNSTYNVGIGGAASGSHKLQVTGTTNLTGKLTINTGGTDDQFQLVGTAPSYRMTNAVTGATINGFIAMAGATNNYIQGAESGDMCIGNQNNGKILLGFGAGTATLKMTITSAGNVGIGTSSPSSFAGYNNLSLQASTSGYNLDFFNNSGVRKAAIIYNNAVNFTLSAIESIPMVFETAGVERMRINASGSSSFSGNVNINDTYGLYMGVGGEQRILAGGTTVNTYLTFSNWTGSAYAERMRITSGGAVIANGPVYRYSGQTVVGGSFTNLTAIDLSSSRTYLIQMIPTNTEAGLSYRIFGVIQANATSSTYSFVSVVSQTMDVTFSGTTVQARVTNGQQWTFNWSITQLL